MIERPKGWDNLQINITVLHYIEDLEDIVLKISGDSIGKLYMALKGQIDGIADVLSSTYITDISDKDDKVFDRIVKLSTDSKKIVENMKYLEAQMNQDQIIVEPDAGSVEGIVKGIKAKKHAHSKV